MLLTSLQTLPEARHFPPRLLPTSITWENYPTLSTRRPSAASSLNSLIVTGSAVLGNLVFCSLAGYAFARLRFFGRDVIFIVLLATLMVPFQVVMIPTFLIIQKLSLADSLTALALPNLVTPFGIFLLRQFFRTLPVELEEAARIDGCSRLGVLWRVVLPLSGPALATVAVVTFLWTWNDFLWPLIVITSTDHNTVQLGLANFQGAHTTNWTLLMAGNVMSLAPMLIVFVVAQRFFVRSIAGIGDQGVAMGEVRFDDVTKVFDGGAVAVDALDLTIGDGELLVLVGPSGCGKTTALRMVAGLETPTSGTIWIGDRVVNDVSPANRDIAMVFQNYALYPHMNVERNIGVPAGAAQGAEGRAAAARRRGRRDARPDAAAQAQAGAAVGRPAAAGGDGPGAVARAGRIPARRAALQPRREAADGAAGGAQAAPRAGGQRR